MVKHLAPSVGIHTQRLRVSFSTTNMLGQKMKGISTPDTPHKRSMRRRKAEKQRISSFEAKVELLFNSADAMQDLNKTLQDHNECLHEQQIGLQANQWGWKDAYLARSRRPLPCLNRVTSSAAPTSRAPILRKSSLLVAAHAKEKITPLRPTAKHRTNPLFPLASST